MDTRSQIDGLTFVSPDGKRQSNKDDYTIEMHFSPCGWPLLLNLRFVVYSVPYTIIYFPIVVIDHSIVQEAPFDPTLRYLATTIRDTKLIHIFRLTKPVCGV